jgi:pyruvate dehydrogenase E2 component (dihydrolipoamide acetyltransferase)
MGEFRMPSLGADMEHGTVSEWLVEPGAVVHRGDIVAVIATDKSDIDAEVFEDGVVDEILVPTGTEVDVGTVLARIRPAGVDAHEAEPAAAAPVAVGAVAASVGREATPTPVPGGAAVEAGRHGEVHSPVVRALAHELGVDLATVDGSGPGGRITRRDVLAAVPDPSSGGHRPRREPHPRPRPRPPAPGGIRPRITPLARRLAGELGIASATLVAAAGPDVLRAADIERLATTASRPGPPPPGETREAGDRAALVRLMERSNREIPHYHLATTVDLGAALEWLDAHNQARTPAERLLPAALLLKATATAAASSPTLNGWWRDGGLHGATGVDLGVIISRRGGGLAAPTITGAHELALDEVMRQLRELVGRVRSGRLRSSDLAPASVSVTNLGDQGVEEVYGVIHPPQLAIVGFGGVTERPLAVDGQVVVRPTVRATLAADHRASDGHQGARLLQTIDRLLQHPEAL